MAGGSFLHAQEDPLASYESVAPFSDGRRDYRIALECSCPDSVSVDIYCRRGRKWKPFMAPLPFSTDSDAASVSLEDSLKIVDVGGHKYASFGLLYREGPALQYVLVLSDPFVGGYEAVSFVGRDISAGCGDMRIEGISDLGMCSDTTSDSFRWLAAAVVSDPRLSVLSDADYLTDKSIRWWQDQNPSAQTSATSLRMCRLPEESSIVKEFSSAKASERGRHHVVAVYEVRDWTVVVSRSLSTGEYTLVWAEPECRNRATDRYLRGLYFESDNSVALLFYKGKSFFKYHVNLATKAIRRS